MFRLKEETLCYQKEDYESDRLIWNLYSNAFRIIKSVYIFQNFSEYCRQLESDKQEDKLEIYWNTSYNEKLIDYIKISVAFETFNKATLIKKGILVHKIDSKFNNQLAKRQGEGFPIKVSDFLMNNYSKLDIRNKKAELNGFREYFPTINYSHTLNENYQKIIGLDKQLLFELQKINQKRNKLHFFTDFKGAFSIADHIRKWNYVMINSFETIESELKKANEKIKNYA
jgi:hypothetical protein